MTMTDAAPAAPARSIEDPPRPTEASGPDPRPATLARRLGPASGAMVAPFAQALSSLALQVIAVRELGADGFGVYALLYAAVVMAMALSNGLVGDSLTVLDRGRPEVRGAISVTAWASTIAAGAIAVVATGSRRGPMPRCSASPWLRSWPRTWSVAC